MSLSLVLVLIYYSNHWNKPPVYNKFTLTCRFWSLLFTHEIYAKEETFGISSPITLEEDHEAWQESRHAMDMTPNDPRTEASTCKSSGTQPENSEACIARIQALTMKETTPKAHMQVHTNKESCEKQPRRKPGPTWAEMGLGRLAQPTTGPVRHPLCPRCFSINCLCLRLPPRGSNQSIDAIHQKTAAARWRRELDDLVARINTGGGKEARGGLQAAGLGVFPSFIATIFIDDVLRSLHHPYVLQSL
jgi:hypothetical protein